MWRFAGGCRKIGVDFKSEWWYKGTINTETDTVATNIDLSRNLTQKRLPAELQGFDTYRLIIWEVDPDTGGRMVYDIYETSGAKSAIAMFNSSRARWASEGMQVSMEPSIITEIGVDFKSDLGYKETMDNGDRQMTITTDLNTAFTNTQKLASLIQDDPNPHRTAYVRLIGELEGVLIDVYRCGNAKTKALIESHLESLIRRQNTELGRREIDAQVAQRLKSLAE